MIGPWPEGGRHGAEKGEYSRHEITEKIKVATERERESTTTATTNKQQAKDNSITVRKRQHSVAPTSW